MRLRNTTTTRALLAASVAGLLSTDSHANTITTGWLAEDYNNDGTWEVSESDVANFAQTPNAVWSGTGTLVNASTNFANVNAYVSNPLFELTRPGDSSASYQELLGGEAPSQVNASWEVIFRPGDFTGDHIIFETGGNVNGSIIRLFDNTLNVRFQDSNSNGQEFSTDLSTFGSATDFFHVTTTFDVGAGNAGSSLYVNGINVGPASLSPTTDVADWVGGDGSGLGKVGGGATAGSLSYTNFGGDVALMRHYNGALLNTNEVRISYESTTTGAQAATVGWDAAYYDGDGTWEVGTYDSSYANAGSMVFTGTGSVQSGNTNFKGIKQWVNAPAMNLTGTGGASIETVLGAAFTQQDATIETVFRPGDFTGRHALFEVGGSGDGVVLQIDGSTLSLIFQELNAGGTGNVLQYDADLSLIGDADEFFHIVGVMDVGNPNSLSGLYVNGVLIGSAGSLDTVNDWAGGNGGSIGQKNSSSAGGNVSYDAFTGDIATFRLYDKALTQADVNTAFGTVPEPSSLALLGLGGLMLARRRR